MESVLSSQPMTTLTEIFPVKVASLPSLSAYQLVVRNGDLATIGGRLSYRLHKALPGHWIWTHPWIVTDNPQPIDAIKQFVQTAWSEQPQTFQNLLDIQLLANWTATPQAYADFTARGIWSDLKSTIARLLSTWTIHLDTISISRSCQVRGWVVQGQPALSLSLESRLLTNQDVQTYINNEPSVDAVIDLLVTDKESTLKGIVTAIAGSVGEHRARLLRIAGDSPSKVHIEAARDHEAVLSVYAPNQTTYDYVARGLQIIVRTSDYGRFRVNGQHATAQLRLAPQKRSEMISQLAQLAKDRGLIGSAYSSTKFPQTFLNTTSVQFTPSLVVGNNYIVRDPKDRAIQKSLQQYGLYRRSSTLDGEPIRIGVLNMLPNTTPNPFLAALQRDLLLYKFPSVITHTSVIRSQERYVLEEAIGLLKEKQSHLILALFPNDTGGKLDTTRWTLYDHFKSLTIGADIASQIVQQTTMHNTYALGNITLGILSKLGNVPYVLASPLAYTDIIVGIDIARRQKARLSGSLNATALARIHQNTGEFLHYTIHDAPLEGETIPDDVLRSLFPASVFAGKRVVIHRDGLFRGEEKQALKKWGTQIKAQFLMVEIIKTGTPRLYQFHSQGSKRSLVIQQPTKGSTFKLSEYEAFLVSSLPPFTNVTPYPIHIRSEAPFPIEQAIHSVLSLTLLHFGSLRTPRLPVTIHYSDEIAYLALKGIKPKSLEGNIPFWL